jgi:hypothetical protein
MKKISLALVTIVLGSLHAASFAQTVPSRENTTIDCDYGEDLLGTDHQVLMPTETLSVTLLNCDGWNLDDRSAGGVMVIGGIPTDNFNVTGGNFDFVVTGEADIDFDPPGGWIQPPTWIDASSSDIDLYVYIAEPSSDPAGELVLEKELVFAQSDLPQFLVGSAITDEGDYLFGGDADCNVENGYHVYQTFTIAVTATGAFTFRVPWVTPVDEDLYWGAAYYPSQDFFLAVYSEFDEDNPEDNLFGCNDDRDSPPDYVSFGSGSSALIADDQAPGMTVNLNPGNYTLLLATYRSVSTQSYNIGEFSLTSEYADGAFNTNWVPTQMSAFLELWGPRGSIIPDTDGDGVPDNQDTFPSDPSRWLHAVPVPIMPLSLLALLCVLLAGAGLRKLKLGSQ